MKRKKVRHGAKSSGMTVVLYMLWRLLRSITVHTRKNLIYLFYTIKIQMVHWRILGHEKRKTSMLTWSDVDLTPSVCVPMKMPTEVTLLYKHIYYLDSIKCWESHINKQSIKNRHWNVLKKKQHGVDNMVNTSLMQTTAISNTLDCVVSLKLNVCIRLVQEFLG